MKSVREIRKSIENYSKIKKDLEHAIKHTQGRIDLGHIQALNSCNSALVDLYKAYLKLKNKEE